MQRIAILAVIVFVIVFGLAWWARTCQHNRKVESYRTFFDGVSTAIDDSQALGKQFAAIVVNPTKYSRKELIAKLNTLKAGQAEIATRADRLEAPDSLADQKATFATGMKVRADGFRLLRAAMVDALSRKKVDADELASLAGYFSGPDAYYMDLVYLQSRTIMKDQGVTDVAVPTATYYLDWKAFDRDNLESLLDRVGSSAKLTGVHGVALISVTAKTGTEEIKLVKGKTNDISASADLSFVVRVQNQGNVTETNVPVAATVVVPSGSPLKKTASIATIAAGKTESVAIQGFTFEEQDLSKVCTLKVKAGPVSGELSESNNSASYKILLQLK